MLSYAAFSPYKYPMDLSNFLIYITFNTLLAKIRSTCFIHVKFCVICKRL